MIKPLPLRYDVTEAVEQITRAPELWDLHPARTAANASPHSGVMDIWLRFNPLRNIELGGEAFFLGPHVSEWYPAADNVPAVRDLVERLFRDVKGVQLGGVLITRIPPGGEVKPHKDFGWHASYYEKFAIQLKSNSDQAFCFQDSQLSPLPGDAYTFDNSQLHWVINPTNEDRMTLIVCIRRNHERVH